MAHTGEVSRGGAEPWDSGYNLKVEVVNHLLFSLMWDVGERSQRTPALLA